MAIPTGTLKKDGSPFYPYTHTDCVVEGASRADVAAKADASTHNLKTYTSLAQIGLAPPVTVVEICAALPNQSQYLAIHYRGDVTDLPCDYACLSIRLHNQWSCTIQAENKLGGYRGEFWRGTHSQSANPTFWGWFRFAQMGGLEYIGALSASGEANTDIVATTASVLPAAGTYLVVAGLRRGARNQVAPGLLLVSYDPAATTMLAATTIAQGDTTRSAALDTAGRLALTVRAPYYVYLLAAIYMLRNNAWRGRARGKKCARADSCASHIAAHR
nr:hypothetical protein [Maliibacterium massiliense]